MPKIKAPSPSGKFKKSNKATVANVRIKILTHIGRINKTTIVREVLNRAWLNIQAAGYPSSRQRMVVIKAIPTEYTKVFIASGEDIFVDTNDVWDDGDHVGITIAPDKIRIIHA